jgi:hypothetical protein
MQTTPSFLVSRPPPPSWFPTCTPIRGVCFGCLGTIFRTVVPVGRQSPFEHAVPAPHTLPPAPQFVLLVVVRTPLVESRGV